MNDELLDRLGNYFVYFDILNRKGITFEVFLEKWNRGVWEL